MSHSPLLYQRDGRLVRITLNRPEVLNAINSAMPEELADAVERANAEPDVRVIVPVSYTHLTLPTILLV